jgi:spermidine/putrescine transport system substrate-binding protein
MAFDSTMRYTVPYALSITAVAYLKTRVNNVIPSWKMYNREDLRGRMTMLNDYREVIGAALMVDGKNINTLDEQCLVQARDQALRWKKNLAKFENEQYKSGLASEEFFLIQGFSGDILQIQRENPNIDYFIPEEGAIISMDEMAIARDSKNAELAHAFIDFMLTPQTAAENIEYINFLCPNRAAYPLLKENWQKNPLLFPPASIRLRLQTLKDLGEENVKYTRIWDQIKAGE